MNASLLHKLLAVVGLAALLALALAAPVQAFEGRGGDNVTIPAGEVVADDLYVGANTFTLDGAVQGDLIVFGATITINGTVEGDLMAAGQTVIVNGQVMDDVRMTGSALTVGEGAQVAGDVLAAGYSLEAKSPSSIGGDVIYGGGQALLAGEIAGDVLAGAGGLQLNGSVAGNVDADVGSAENMSAVSPFMFMPNAPAVPNVPAGLTIGPEASIGGNLEYTSDVPVNIPAGVVAGQMIHREPTVDREARAERAARTGILGWFLDNLRTLATLLVVGLLMVWLAPNFIRAGAAALQARPLPSLGWGIVSIFAVFFALLVLIAVVIILAIILGIITLGDLLGITISGGILAAAALIFGFIVAAAYISKIVVSYLGGRLILRRIQPEWAESRVWPLVIGVVIFTILAAIPILGGIFSLIVILLGLGALWLLVWQRFGPRPALPPAAAAD
jgi:cytoskeletal protein CcmA (bactofilin family)